MEDHRFLEFGFEWRQSVRGDRRWSRFRSNHSNAWFTTCPCLSSMWCQYSFACHHARSEVSTIVCVVRDSRLKRNEIFIERMEWEGSECSFRYIMAGLSTGCLIVFNVNFNALNQPRRENALTKSAVVNPSTSSATFLQWFPRTNWLNPRARARVCLDSSLCNSLSLFLVS